MFTATKWTETQYELVQSEVNLLRGFPPHPLSKSVLWSQASFDKAAQCTSALLLCRDSGEPAPLSRASSSSPSLCSSISLSAASGSFPPAADLCFHPWYPAAERHFPWSSRCQSETRYCSQLFLEWRTANTKACWRHVASCWEQEFRFYQSDVGWND